MVLRFRRSIRIAPGVRLNLGKRGASVSAGIRGASISVGSRGIFGNVGLPGTGFSVRNRLDKPAVAKRARDNSPAAVESGTSVRFVLNDDGTVELQDPSGAPLPNSVQRRAKKEAKSEVLEWLDQQTEHWNRGIQDLLEMHLDTPPPEPPASFQSIPFDTPSPAPPRLAKLGLLERFWKNRRQRLELQNRQLTEQYEQEMGEWKRLKEQHEQSERTREEHFNKACRGDAGALMAILEDHLGSLNWPRETIVNAELDDDHTVWLNVDLPEIEDLPVEQASVSKSRFKINVKEKSDTQRRREYSTHIHGIGFRLAGEMFHLFPNVSKVVVSGYSQRSDPATGQIRDDYLFSAIIPVERWRKINFKNLRVLDLSDCFSKFQLRRNMTKTGIFRPIEPYRPGETASL